MINWLLVLIKSFSKTESGNSQAPKDFVFDKKNWQNDENWQSWRK